MRTHHLAAICLLSALVDAAPAQSLRWLDLDGDAARQSTVHRESGQYLGHPTTVLLADGRTLLCVHPKGHGRGAIVLQRSSDGGRTWSEPLPVPDDWATSLETPTIHRLADRDGRERLIVFSGLYPIRRSLSADQGTTWTPLEPIGDFGGIVAMSSVVQLANGEHAAFFHDDGRFFAKGGKRDHFVVYQTRSGDGGITWGTPTVVWSGTALDLCEPGVVRSPDGKRLLLLLRENSRRQSSQAMWSDDEGATWSAPVELPQALCGDRHVAAYAPDGRLVVSFRDMAANSPTRGDWVAWIGTFDDLVARRDGQYRVRLSRNWHGTDCGYPGVEVLGDGTLVLVSYGHWEPGEAPFVRAVRFRLDELDALAKGPAPTFAREPATVRPVPRHESWWQQRVAGDLAAARAGGHRLLFLGDSITQGWNAAGEPIWRERWAPRGALNLGVSGDRTQHVLWRLDHGLLDALAGDGNDVRAVVVLIGTNNSGGDECSAKDIAAGIAAIVARLRTGLPQAKVLLLAILPRSERPDAQRAKCAEASAHVAAALSADAMVVCRDIGQRFVRDDGTIDAAVMPDFLHLSAAGYGIWADAIAAEVEALLGR